MYIVFVLTVSIRPKKGEDLKRCLHCQFTRYCSEQRQRKNWDFHRFAFSVVAKKSDIVKA